MFNTVKLDNFKKHQHVTINLSLLESQVPGELKLEGQSGSLLAYSAKLGKISEGNFTVIQMALSKFGLLLMWLNSRTIEMCEAKESVEVRSQFIAVFSWRETS